MADWVYLSEDRNAAGAVVGDLYMCAYTDCGDMSDESFDGLQAFFRKVTTHVTSKRPYGILCYSPSFVPTAKQRKESAEMFDKIGPPDIVVLLTGSVLVRGAMTAVNWLIPQNYALEVLQLNRRDDALKHLSSRIDFDVVDAMAAYDSMVKSVTMRLVR